MQAVGKLDQNDADVLCHGKEHLPQVFCLNLQLIRIVGEPAQLRDPVHQKRHLTAELQPEPLIRYDGILYHVVEKSRDNRLLVKLQLRQDDRHTKGMNNISLAGFANLPLMGIIRNPEGFFNH